MVLSLLIIVVLEILIAYGVIFLAHKAVVLSKVTFALLLGVILNVNRPILEGNSFAGFLIYAAIALAISFLLCLSPRFDCAFQFFCTAIICYFITEIVGFSLLAVVLGIFGQKFEFSVTTEIIVKLVSIFAAGKALLSKLEEKDDMNIFKGKILTNIERAVASLVYGITLYFLFAVSLNDMLPLPVAVQWIVFVGGIAGSFAADYFLVGNE